MGSFGQSTHTHTVKLKGLHNLKIGTHLAHFSKKTLVMKQSLKKSKEIALMIVPFCHALNMNLSEKTNTTWQSKIDVPCLNVCH